MYLSQEMVRKQEAHLQAGEVYALQEKETGKWFAFQIVEIGEENAVYVDLDYWRERMPEESDLDKMCYLWQVVRGI